MTDIRITEADREAAQALCVSGWTHAGAAFARHRIEAVAKQDAEIQRQREVIEAWHAIDRRRDAEAARLTNDLKERAKLIVELLVMPKANVGFAGDVHIRRARRIIDGDNDAKAQGEANYRAYCAADPDHVHDGTIDELKLVARMIDEYAADALPANEHGQIHFARAMLESAGGAIKAYLAALKEPSHDEG